MNIQFRENDLDKRDSIVNAALEEFSLNSFEKASTNNIVKQAKVSKGLLYHYFKSKQDLYDYLVDFVMITIGDELREKLDFTIGDFFERVQAVTMIKLAVMKQYPNLYEFGMKLLKDMSYEKVVEMSKKYNLDLFQRIYSENIDFSLFKDEIDQKKAMTMIQWVIEKFSENLQYDEGYDGKKVVNEMNSYLDILKLAFYK